MIDSRLSYTKGAAQTESVIMVASPLVKRRSAPAETSSAAYESRPIQATPGKGLSLYEQLRSQQLQLQQQLDQVQQQIDVIEGVDNGFLATVAKRTSVLVALLLTQSLSSMILERYEVLLASHMIVTLFLTMLVGAGGNAGNQSAVNVIRGLATGAIGRGNTFQLVVSEFATGVVMATLMCMAAFVRVIYSQKDEDPRAGYAIVFSLFVIVVASVVLGTLLPLLFAGVGLDPAHAGPAIQVVMDILGVGITCLTCFWVLMTSDGSTVKNE